MAWSKMVGLEVRPVTESSAMYCLRVPVLSRSRVMLSSQILWPRLCKSSVAFIFVFFLVGLFQQICPRGVLAGEAPGRFIVPGGINDGQRGSCLCACGRGGL